MVVMMTRTHTVTHTKTDTHTDSLPKKWSYNSEYSDNNDDNDNNNETSMPACLPACLPNLTVQWKTSVIFSSLLRRRRTNDASQNHLHTCLYLLMTQGDVQDNTTTDLIEPRRPTTLCWPALDPTILPSPSFLSLLLSFSLLYSLILSFLFALLLRLGQGRNKEWEEDSKGVW